MIVSGPAAYQIYTTCEYPGNLVKIGLHLKIIAARQPEQAAVVSGH
jgi:hypothetical protein